MQLKTKKWLVLVEEKFKKLKITRKVKNMHCIDSIGTIIKTSLNEHMHHFRKKKYTIKFSYTQ